MESLSVTEEVVYRKLIESFINRLPITIELPSTGSPLTLKFFRHGDVFRSSDDQEYEVSQTGVFSEYYVTVNNKNPIKSWFFYCALDQIDHLIPKNVIQREELFMQLTFQSAMRKINRKHV